MGSQKKFCEYGTGEDSGWYQNMYSIPYVSFDYQPLCYIKDEINKHLKREMVYLQPYKEMPQEEGSSAVE